jgi:excisionase family DNA binding protein
VPIQSNGSKLRRSRPADMPELRSVDYAAEFLDVHPRTIRRMLNSGELNAYRVGRLVRVDMRQVYALAQPVSPESVSA